ncbi:uncharacterized protein LOC128552317, partial [Mercenaria mercenaria]|uniref:uncharacterized protein LOC128552317 n=1 Tax=Mercenaria mercenaria TaxID=6596 RepID=UPI00234EA074
MLRNMNERKIALYWNSIFYFMIILLVLTRVRTTAIRDIDENFSYIGNLSILWRGQSSRETIVNSIQNQLKIIYTNDTLEDTTYRLPMSSLFVSATVLSLEEDRSVSPMHLYTVMYNLRMGEHVGRDRVSNVLKTMFNGGSLLIRYTQNIDMTFRNTSYYIFRDSDNILCNLTSNGNCDPVSTDCRQQNG